MSNIPVKVTFGTPSVGITWPRGAVITEHVEENKEGRWEAWVSLNGQVISLPGTHPTELDARATVEAYVKEHKVI